MTPRFFSSIRAPLALCLALLLAGCAGFQAYREGQSELADGRLEPGISKLKQATEQSPNNVEYRSTYFTQRDNAVATLLRRAEQATDQGDFDAASRAYAEALRIDPGNARASAGANKVEAAQRQWKALEAAQAQARQGALDEAVARVQEVLSENPQHARAQALLRSLLRQQADRGSKELGIYPKLKAAYRAPVSLSFSNATLQQVFDALKQASGLNYVFDKEVKIDARVTLSVTNKPVQDILRLLLATNQLEQRVLDEDTLLIYPNTPAKAAEYREMVVRTFYLANVEASKIAAMVKTIARAKDVVVDEKLNLLVVRDSADVVRLVEKLIAAQDLPEPEVMLELEVLEVSVNRLIEMGISWPNSVSATVQGAAGVAGQLTPGEVRHFHPSLVKLNFGDPVAAAQLRGQATNADLLANPRVRVRNKQSAKILIGERVPVFTTTATANVGTSESVNYLDVGLKLEIEPAVSLDDDVSMKLALEVSNILETITRTSGTQAYRLGTRNTSTTLRVHDGETNILAGLIQREDRHSNTGVPGLNEIPLLNRLFGAAQDSDNRTEIVLLVTPHIIRNVELPGVGLQEFMSGTDAAVGAGPIQLGASQGSTPLQPQTNRPVYTSPAQAPQPQQMQRPFIQPRPATPSAPTAPASPTSPSPPPALTPPLLVPVSPTGDGSANPRQANGSGG